MEYIRWSSSSRVETKRLMVLSGSRIDEPLKKSCVSEEGYFQHC